MDKRIIAVLVVVIVAVCAVSGYVLLKHDESPDNKALMGEWIAVSGAGYDANGDYQEAMSEEQLEGLWIDVKAAAHGVVSAIDVNGDIVTGTYVGDRLNIMDDSDEDDTYIFGKVSDNELILNYLMCDTNGNTSVFNVILTHDGVAPETPDMPETTADEALVGPSIPEVLAFNSGTTFNTVVNQLTGANLTLDSSNFPVIKGTLELVSETGPVLADIKGIVRPDNGGNIEIDVIDMGGRYWTMIYDPDNSCMFFEAAAISAQSSLDEMLLVSIVRTYLADGGSVKFYDASEYVGKTWSANSKWSVDQKTGDIVEQDFDLEFTITSSYENQMSGTLTAGDMVYDLEAYATDGGFSFATVIGGIYALGFATVSSDLKTVTTYESSFGSATMGLTDHNETYQYLGDWECQNGKGINHVGEFVSQTRADNNMSFWDLSVYSIRDGLFYGKFGTVDVAGTVRSNLQFTTIYDTTKYIYNGYIDDNGYLQSHIFCETSDGYVTVWNDVYTKEGTPDKLAAFVELKDSYTCSSAWMYDGVKTETRSGTGFEIEQNGSLIKATIELGAGESTEMYTAIGYIVDRDVDLGYLTLTTALSTMTLQVKSDGGLLLTGYSSWNDSVFSREYSEEAHSYDFPSVTGKWKELQANNFKTVVPIGFSKYITTYDWGFTVDAQDKMFISGTFGYDYLGVCLSAKNNVYQIYYIDDTGDLYAPIIKLDETMNIQEYDIHGYSYSTLVTSTE